MKPTYICQICLQSLSDVSIPLDIKISYILNWWQDYFSRYDVSISQVHVNALAEQTKMLGMMKSKPYSLD